MSNLTQIAMNMLRNNPNVPNTPWKDSAINAIATGDQKTGEQIANNILAANGLTKEQAMEIARTRLHLPF